MDVSPGIANPLWCSCSDALGLLCNWAVDCAATSEGEAWRYRDPQLSSEFEKDNELLTLRLCSLYRDCDSVVRGRVCNNAAIVCCCSGVMQYLVVVREHRKTFLPAEFDQSLILHVILRETLRLEEVGIPDALSFCTPQMYDSRIPASCFYGRKRHQDQSYVEAFLWLMRSSNPSLDHCHRVSQSVNSVFSCPHVGILQRPSQ